MFFFIDQLSGYSKHESDLGQRYSIFLMIFATLLLLACAPSRFRPKQETPARDLGTSLFSWLEVPTEALKRPRV
jgi:hypothetical protein